MMFCSGLAMAWDYSNFGSNITGYDGVGDGSTGWYGNQENNEVEFKTNSNGSTTKANTGQKWDLEAFYWNSGTSTLTMIGGYNFINGEAWTGYAADRAGTVDPGYVFIDVGNNNTWDYAIGWSYTLGTQSNNVSSLSAVIYDLNGGNLFQNVGATPFGASDPWRTNIAGLTGTDIVGQYFGMETVDGEKRNAIGFNVSSLNLGTGFSTHFTMECGNDNLVGSEVPVPGAIWLLGSGLLGLVGIKRRQQP